MFESDEKKQLRNKYNKLTSISGATGKKAGAKWGAAANLAMLQGGQGNSVFGELKLSEKLADELQVVRDEVDQLHESLEESLYYND